MVLLCSPVSYGTFASNLAGRTNKKLTVQNTEVAPKSVMVFSKVYP